MMRTYIGTKMVRAIPMNRLAYNNLRGWVLPSDENGEDSGYLVEYLDGGKPNHADYDGYISWSPAAQFEAAYRMTSGMNFGLAIEALKKGARVARSRWNDKEMFLYFVPGSTFRVSPPLLGTLSEGTTVDYAAHIYMRTSGGEFAVRSISQADVLSEDWFILDTYKEQE